MGFDGIAVIVIFCFGGIFNLSAVFRVMGFFGFQAFGIEFCGNCQDFLSVWIRAIRTRYISIERLDCWGWRMLLMVFVKVEMRPAFCLAAKENQAANNNQD